MAKLHYNGGKNLFHCQNPNSYMLMINKGLQQSTTNIYVYIEYFDPVMQHPSPPHC